jgi:hypothetical protein
VFDVAVKTGSGGMLLCAIIEPGPRTNQVDVAVVAPSQPGTCMSLMKAHCLFGHPNKDLTQEMAKSLGIEITCGKVLMCEDCTIAKAKQRNLPSVDDDDKTAPTKKGQLLHLDMMSVKVPKGLTLNKNRLRMIADSHKLDMPDDTCRLFQLLREKGVEIKRLRMDNGGENLSLANMVKSKDWKFPLTIEFTARDTPQQNSLVETAFTANVQRSLAVYVAAGVPKEWRYLLFPHVMKYLSKVKNLQPIELHGKTKPRVKHFFGSMPVWTKHLRDFGEAGTVKIRSKMQPKLDDRGVICMFIGYPD